jgi:glycosyltransferase involved in cell wall biosynthesis
MAVALITNYLTGYRLPLYELLARRHDVEILCFGGGDRYTPAWFTSLDEQLATASFPARRISGPVEAFRAASRYRAVIAPFAGGAILPAAYAGTRLGGRPFVLWASVWSQPRSLSHLLALPITRRIYRDADAVVAYGEHVSRFVARIRGRDSDVFVAPQAVEQDVFGRAIGADELSSFRARHDLPSGPLVLYAGRLVREKGIEVLLAAWSKVSADGTLILAGDGPLAATARPLARVRCLGTLSRAELSVAYAAASFAVLPSIPTARFREPWGLVCNEAMHQARPMIATSAVGAVAGGLVRDGETGIVVPPRDAGALTVAIDRLLRDDRLRARLGAAARVAVSPYTYDAMLTAFDGALALALGDGVQGRTRARGS